MPQVYTVEQFEKLNPQNLVRWEDLVQENWNAHTHWETIYASNPLSALAAQQRLFYPRSFTISSSLTALNNPWFIDYGHLMFWFFFLSTFILVMWLVTLHGLAARNVESRFPRRETRGFSRAQTGDVMTAVLPLTWSITMLMHASTHSINFDENTAATSFSFTVIAYQWGWNYYFPRDIVEKLTKGPRLVGRGHVDLNGADTGYSFLLERSRNEYMARLTLRGAFADKSGREVAANFLTLFTRAGGAPAAYTPSSLLTAVWNAATPLETERFGWRASAYALSLAKLQKLATVETQSDVTRNTTAWASAAVGESRLSGFRPTAPQTRVVALRTPADYRMARSVSAPQSLRRGQTAHTPFAAQQRTSVLNAARSAHSFALVGNRLSLIHKHMAGAQQLPANLTWKPRVAFFISRLRQKDAAFGPMHSVGPSWAQKSLPAAPLRITNITPNLWRSSRFSQPSEFTAASPLSSPLFSKNRLTPSTKTAAFGHDLFAQQRLHSGSPYSLTFKAAGLANPDDLGPNNGAATKEINKRLGAYAGLSAALTLSGRVYDPRSDLSFANWTSQAFRKLSAAGFGPQNFIGTSVALPVSAGALNVGLSQTPEVSTTAAAWSLAAVASLGPVSSPQRLSQFAHSLPAARLAAASSFSGAVAANAFFAKIRPFALGGASSLYSPDPLNPSYARPLTSSPALFTAAAPSASTAPTLHKLASAKALPYLAPITTLANLTPQTPVVVNSAFAKAPTAAVSLARPRSQSHAAKLTLAPLFDSARLINQPWTKGQIQLFSTKPKTPSLYSPWLEGPTPSRPVRSTSDKSNDPVNVTGKSNFLGGQPLFTNQAMFNWYWSWSGSTAAFSLPLNKMYRGALSHRAIGGFWGGALSQSPLSSNVIFPESLLAVSKNAHPSLVGGFTYLKPRPKFSQLSPAVLDSEWVALAQTPACLTPEPFEDVDQAFIHQKWTLDLNTTRRSDHTSKFKVTWGPWAQYKKNPAANVRVSPQAFAGVVGSSSALGMSAKQNLRLGLFSETTLPLKTSAGLSLLSPLATSGKYYLDPQTGANLYEALAPRSSLTTSANDWANSLRFKTLVHGAQTFSVLPPATSIGWAALWNFKLNVSDVQATFTRTHPSAFPSYWADRALLVLSAREKYKAALSNAGASTGAAEEALGANHPLFKDILSLYYNPQNKAKSFSLARHSWSGVSNETGWRAGLDKTFAAALEAAVDAHLIARAQYSLVRDEIGSIRRLRVTKGIYLPSDIPMHVVCGSKDVIHSWALPGLNIKIDCIPGFNSHRRLMLRWRGAYWGQCMEVCGRYHHWMPILIHVVHKDVFLGWCLSYLKLIDARAQATTRALSLMASVDLVSLDSTLATLLRIQQTRPNTLQGLSNYIVHADLED